MKRLLFKIALAILGLLIGGAGALYVIGGRTAVYRADVEINAPPTTVFAYLTETELLPQWMDGVTKIEPLTDGMHGVGAKSRVTIHDSQVIEDEVLESKPGELLQIRLTSPGLDAISTYDLHSHGSHTHLSHEFQADFGGIARIFAPFVAGSIQSKLDEDFQRLKQLIESEPSGNEAASP